MLLEDLPDVLKRLRRGPLLPPGGGVAVDCNREGIERLLPHRAPFLLVDRIEAIDLEARTLRAERRVAASDPVFTGHFPGDPVYPGVLVVEAMGQAAATLHHFVTERTWSVGPDVTPKGLRATRIHHAAFFAPVLPDDTITLHAEVLHDEFTMIAATQAFRGEQLAAVAVLEVLGDD